MRVFLLLPRLCACVYSCGRDWSVCEAVLVPYVVGAVVALTVMRVLLFVLDVSIRRECEGDGNASVGDGEVWLRLVRGMCMWVLHVTQVLYLAQMTF